METNTSEHTSLSIEEKQVALKTGVNSYFVAAWIFALVAISFAILGIHRMYTYDILDDKIVGGDAYNYQILATRGVGLICVGIISAVIACMLALFSLRK